MGANSMDRPTRRFNINFYSPNAVIYLYIFIAFIQYCHFIDNFFNRNQPVRIQRCRKL